MQIPSAKFPHIFCKNCIIGVIISRFVRYALVDVASVLVVVVMLIVSFGFRASALLNLTHKWPLQLRRVCAGLGSGKRVEERGMWQIATAAVGKQSILVIPTGLAAARLTYRVPNAELLENS